MRPEILRPIQVTYEALDLEQAAVCDAIAAGPRRAIEGPLRVRVLNPALKRPGFFGGGLI